MNDASMVVALHNSKLIHLGLSTNKHTVLYGMPILPQCTTLNTKIHVIFLWIPLSRNVSCM